MSGNDKLLLTEKTKRTESIIRSKESTDNLSINYEIECPRCHDTMILCSELIEFVTCARNAVFALL
jgi:hypothetical protein